VADNNKKKSQVAGIDIGSLPRNTRISLEGEDLSRQSIMLGAGGSETDNWDAPVLILANNEDLIRKGNAGIRLGKDRESHVFSGTGGKPGSHNAAIDIVAGNMGWVAKGEDSVNPDFKIDAARIYLSQKSNVDGYFELVEGNVGSTSNKNLRSTVALKADTVRIIGRENIKLVTRTDDYNSQGGQVGKNTYVKGYGIDLIALNDDKDMQPLVKGDNLVECLTGLIDVVNTVTEILQNFFEYDSQFKKAVQTHTHMSPFYGIETPPDFKAIMTAGVKTAIASTLNVDVPLMMDYPLEVAALKNDYLEGEGMPGPKYICSKYNSTN
jgi:hypothetical protein